MPTNFDIRNIPVDIIDDPQDPMREKMNEAGIYELLQSIKGVGLLQAITVVKHPQHPAGQCTWSMVPNVYLDYCTHFRYEVVAGHRRLAACRMGSIPEILCHVVDLKNEDIEIAKIHENIFREDVNNVEEAKSYALLRDKHNQTIEQIALSIKKSTSYVRSRLDLLNYPDYIQNFIREGRLNQSVAYWLNKLSNERVKREYTEFAVRQGVNALYAKAWYESYERGALAANPGDQPILETVAPEGYCEPEIECMICADMTPLSQHVLAYCHSECLRAIADARNSADEK